MGKGASHFSFDSRLSYWFYCLCNSSFHQTLVHIFLLLFSSSVLSNFLWPHGLHHIRLPCPSLSPRVCSNSCPLSRWSHPTILSSVTPFSYCLQSFPASGSFPVSWIFASHGQSIRASASALVLPMHNWGCFSLGLTDLISLLSRGFSRVVFGTTIQKHQFLGLSFMSI